MWYFLLYYSLLLIDCYRIEDFLCLFHLPYIDCMIYQKNFIQSTLDKRHSLIRFPGWCLIDGRLNCKFLFKNAEFIKMYFTGVP